MPWVAWRITLGLGSMVTIPWLGSVVYLPMVIVVVSEMGSFPFQMAVSWLFNAGDPNYLQVLGWSSTCPFWGKILCFSLPKVLKWICFTLLFENQRGDIDWAWLTFIVRWPANGNSYGPRSVKNPTTTTGKGEQPKGITDDNGVWPGNICSTVCLVWLFLESWRSLSNEKNIHMRPTVRWFPMGNGRQKALDRSKNPNISRPKKNHPKLPRNSNWKSSPRNHPTKPQPKQRYTSPKN